VYLPFNCNFYICVLIGYVRLRKNNGLKNRSVNLDLTLLRNIFKYALEIGAIVNNPTKEVKNMSETIEVRTIPTSLLSG